MKVELHTSTYCATSETTLFSINLNDVFLLYKADSSWQIFFAIKLIYEKGCEFYNEGSY